MTFEAQTLGPDLPSAPQRSAPTPAVTAGSLIARTFSTWWSRLWIFAALTVVVLVPMYAISFAIMFTVGVSRGRLGVVLPFVLMALVWLALFVQACGHTHGAVQHLSGRPVHLGAMLRAGLDRLLAVIGLVVLGVLAYLGFVLVLMLVGAVFAFFGGSGFMAAALAVIAVPVGLVLGTGLSLTIPVMVAERVGPITGLRRSWVLTRGRRGAIFVALLAAGLVLAGIMAAQLGVIWATQLGAGGLPDTGPAISIGLMLLMFVVWILAASLLPVVPAVAYHDLRLEKEGASDLAQVFQ